MKLRGSTGAGLSRGRALTIGWVAFTLLYSVQSITVRVMAGQELEWGAFAANELFYVGLLAAQTPIILWFADRFPLGGARRLRHTGIHLAAGIVIGLDHRFIYEVVTRQLRATAERPFSLERAWQSALAYFEIGLFLYFLVVLAVHMWEYYERYNEERLQAAHLRADLSAAQLETLRMQVQPHFLFNTLNAISVLVEEDPPTARRMIGHLSDFLRATLHEGAKQEIPLRRELELLQHYLRIEETRFGDRLRVELRVDPSTLDEPVPALLLQPLVENAIRHGLSRRPGAGKLEIEVERTIDGDRQLLVLRVRDRSEPSSSSVQGPGGEIQPPTVEAPATQGGLGIGLSNTQARLERLYGKAQRLTLERLGDSGSVVTIAIPRPVSG